MSDTLTNCESGSEVAELGKVSRVGCSETLPNRRDKVGLGRVGYRVYPVVR